MKKLYPLFVFLLLTVLSTAQDGILSGRIIDDQFLPLTGAHVQVGEHAATSDINGYYTLVNLPVGPQTVQITFIGFETITRDITIGEEGENVLDVQMQPGISLQEVVVTSQLKGQAKALNNQLQRDDISNIISADQIGRFPDANVGDALKRIPGINVQYDQGEARFGNIRGTSPELNSITINGERIPSAEAEIRSIQLDLIPSDMIQTIELSKAVTPDMDADAIGGSVNLVTRAAPSAQRISATLGGGYNLLANEPTWNGSLIYGNRFADDKFGIILSASYFDNNLGSDNMEAEWTFDDANDNDKYDEGEEFWPEEIQIRQYYLQRIRQSYSASLDYEINDQHRLFLRGIYNQRNDWENRYRSIFADIEEDDGQWVAELERETKSGTEDIKYARLEDQEMMNFSLSGEHLFGKLRVDWMGTLAKASEDRPNERYFAYATDDVVPVNVDFSDLRMPMIEAADAAFRNPSQSWEIGDLTEEFQYTEDVDFNTKLNFALPLASGTNASLLKFGARLRSKNKTRNNDFYEYGAESDQTFDQSLNNLVDQSKDNFLAGDYQAGSFASKEFVGDLNLSNGFEQEQDLSELAGNFDATEQILAGYAMLEQNLGNQFKILAGVRFEQTDLEYEGFQFDDQEESLSPTNKTKNNYSNFLPGLHLRYNVKPRTVLRFAWTNTLARPNYFDLVPYREIADGEELSIGNPTLEATTSMNFDLMAEHYFGTVGLISGGVFYKNLKDITITQNLFDYEFEGTVWDNFSQPINGGNASLFGAEVTFQRQLDFIAPALKGLGLYFNYTFIQSKINDFNIEGREDEDLELPGSPNHTLNLSLAYDAKKFTTRLSFNYASDFISEFGDGNFSDVYYDAVTYLDFNLNYSLNKNWVIYLNANNLLNQPLRFYQGVADRTYQAEYYNVRFDLGVKFDLNK